MWSQRAQRRIRRGIVIRFDRAVVVVKYVRLPQLDRDSVTKTLDSAFVLPFGGKYQRADRVRLLIDADHYALFFGEASDNCLPNIVFGAGNDAGTLSKATLAPIYVP